MKHRMLSVLAISLFTLLHVDPAAAQTQNFRSWVSGVGSDDNNCTRTLPCLTFGAAIGKTATGGEINCLDPGGFGLAAIVVINKSISIRCVGVTAGILTGAPSGITINAPANAEVLLEGLDIEGVGQGGDGVLIQSATKVTIQNCSIRNFAGNGVNVAGPAGARVLIADSTILSNNAGLRIAGTGGASNTGIVMRTVIDNHPVASVVVAAGNRLIMSASKLTGSPTSVSLDAGATFTSFGDNAIQSAGTPTSTIPLR